MVDVAMKLRILEVLVEENSSMDGHEDRAVEMAYRVNENSISQMQ